MARTDDNFCCSKKRADGRSAATQGQWVKDDNALMPPDKTAAMDYREKDRKKATGCYPLLGRTLIGQHNRMAAMSL